MRHREQRPPKCDREGIGVLFWVSPSSCATAAIHKWERTTLKRHDRTVFTSFTQSPSRVHTFTHSHFHTFTHSHTHTFIQSQNHTFTLSHLHTLTLSHFHTFTLSHFHNTWSKTCVILWLKHQHTQVLTSVQRAGEKRDEMSRRQRAQYLTTHVMSVRPPHSPHYPLCQALSSSVKTIRALTHQAAVHCRQQESA